MNENPDMHNFTNPIFTFVLCPSTTLYGPVLDWFRILLWTGVGTGNGDWSLDVKMAWEWGLYLGRRWGSLWVMGEFQLGEIKRVESPRPTTSPFSKPQNKPKNDK
jgi:membrane associated rhomboid family serine protease